MAQLPAWNIPSNLQQLLDSDEDGMWEDHLWDPILLTVMQGTAYDGRAIPLAWQIEFEPVGELFETANSEIRALGVEPDGYGWANVLSSVVERYHPELHDQLHFGDTDLGCCVVWVESEETCKTLMQIAWSLIRRKS